jgi:Zn-dependent peptidase ImmA (M78 family)
MGRWRPWRTLRARGDVTFALATLPDALGGGACLTFDDGHHVVLIDRRLDPAERLAVLAHELVHIERGGVADCLDVGREERAVDRIVAGRLCPDSDLEALVDVLVEVEGGVTAAMVAEEFQVPVVVAERAMRALVERRAGEQEQAG